MAFISCHQVCDEPQNSPDLANLHYCEAVLEYELKQAISSLAVLERLGLCLPSNVAQIPVQRLLKQITELAGTTELAIQRIHNDSMDAERNQRVLLKHKLLVRVYSIASRSLFLDGATMSFAVDWLQSALTMAGQALKSYHVCYMQSGWLGDSIMDAHHLIELVCRWVRTAAHMFARWLTFRHQLRSFAFLLQKGGQGLLPPAEVAVLTHIAAEHTSRMVGN